MTHIVSASEARQQFSDILSRAAHGETVIITKRGKPVVKLLKYGADDSVDARAAAWDRLTAILESGVSLGGDTFDLAWALRPYDLW